MISRLMTRPMVQIVRLSADVDEAVAEASRVLRDGGVVALPTDTIYGMSTLLPFSGRLFELKRRSASKPLGLFVASVDQIPRFAKVSVSMDVLRRLLPGPVTVVFQRRDTLPADFNPDCQKVGFRIPDMEFVQRLAAEFPETPIAQTSANVSGSPLSPLCTQDFEHLWPELDLIVDGDRIEQHSGNRDGSTVVDLSVRGCYSIVRPGCARLTTELQLRACGLIPVDQAGGLLPWVTGAFRNLLAIFMRLWHGFLLFFNLR